MLAALVSEEEVEKALKVSKNNTATGLDGISYEFLKTLNDRYTEDSKQEKPAFNVVSLLTAVFTDIQLHGLIPSTKFAEGWMCPLYKKNDQNEIANYRPITCLNTDYKIFTKTLASRLAIVVVALDQEKAYDKIDHAYLWQTLRKFGIPGEYIQSIKTLYENADTQIMINGHLSSPWKVTRGVCQGDPLSCLIFDLAIEPLAAAMRASDLEGFKIPGSKERLIANLFADDTTTFLSENDDFEILQSILDDWCIASRAKFNTTKTEIIPIGSPEFRKRVVDTKKTNDNNSPIPDYINIAKEEETVRILGAWFGNSLTGEEPWIPLLEKVDKCLAQWERSQPSIEGRKLIVQMIVGGMTQYLTQVQGMPKQIEETLTKKIWSFVWNEKRSPINEETLFAPI